MHEWMAGGATYRKPRFLNTNCSTHRVSEKMECKFEWIPVSEIPLEPNVLVAVEEV